MIDNFTTHCFIEFYYHLGKGFLNEHNSTLTFRQLNESYGVFDGCRELSEMLTDKVFAEDIKDGQSKVIKLQLNNKWINNIEMRLFSDSETIIKAAYLPNDSKIYKIGNGREKVDKYYPLVLRVNTANKDKRKLVLTFMHELTHAYEDYNRFINGKEGLKDKAIRKGYQLNNVGGYSNEYKQMLSYMLYYIENFERNAFVTEIRGELETCDKLFFSIKEIINYIKNLNIYKNYQKIITYIDGFASIADEESKEIVFEWLDEISNLKFNTYNQFVKFIKQKKYEIEKKFNTIIPKMAYDYLTFGNVLNNFNGELPEIKNG